RPGGVYLDIPADTIVQEDTADQSNFGVYKLVDPAPKQVPNDEAISRAVDLIKNAKKPLIILGKGAAYDQTEKQVQQLVAETNIPFLPMSMAKGLIPDDSPHSAASARSLSLRYADLVIVIGALLDRILVYEDAHQLILQANFVQQDFESTQVDS